MSEFKRSRRCGSGACVEVAIEADRVLVRDSKHANGPLLSFTPEEWRHFIERIQSGEFDVVPPETVGASR